jgi:Na+-translocating ferredoxin:NAD+ oxidoreductase subunit E
MNLAKIFLKGVFSENPVFRLALSLCPALAVTSNAVDALGMGLSVMFVITVNNMIVSFIRTLIHPKVRVPVFILSIATIVTVLELTLQAFFPGLYKSLGIYLSLIVVFAIILARAEVFASKNKVIPSIFDGLGMGAGFTGAMLVIGVIRELFGNGTIFGTRIFGTWYDPPLIMILAPGGFLVIGIIIGIINIVSANIEKWKERKESKTMIESGGAA